MSRSKVSILSKYVMAIAILALLFSVAITSARYAVESYGSSSIGIESFDVDVALYDEDGNEVSGDITLDDKTEDLSSYTKVYYLYINNNDKDTLYYKIEEQSGNFCFTVGDEDTRYTTYAGSLETASTTALTLTVSLHPDVTVSTGETQSLSISLYAEYQHTEEYVSVEIEEPEPEPEDENHQSSEGWVGLSSSNISEYLTLSSGTYKFYLAGDITLGSSEYFNWSGVTATVCLNTHTLSGSASYVFDLTNNSSLTIEDCQGNGIVTSSASSTQVVYISDGSTLTVTSGSISGGSAQYSVYLQSSSATLKVSGTSVIEKGTVGGVYLPSNATINLVEELEEGASIGVTVADTTSIVNDSQELFRYKYGSRQITSDETSTSYYINASKYIYSDDSLYKVSVSNSGYLNLISVDTINFTVALEGTSDDSSSYTFYIDGGTGWDWQDSGTWNYASVPWTGGTGENSYYIANFLSSYSGSNYSYNYYFNFGVIPNNEEFTFGIVPNEWYTNLYQYSLAPAGTEWSGWDAEYFYLWGNQYTEASGGNSATDPFWGLSFITFSDETMKNISDLTLVLQLDYSGLAEYGTNNIVTGLYFLVDGATQGSLTISSSSQGGNQGGSGQGGPGGN